MRSLTDRRADEKPPGNKRSWPATSLADLQHTQEGKERIPQVQFGAMLKQESALITWLGDSLNKTNYPHGDGPRYLFISNYLKPHQSYYIVLNLLQLMPAKSFHIYPFLQDTCLNKS